MAPQVRHIHASVAFIVISIKPARHEHENVNLAVRSRIMLPSSRVLVILPLVCAPVEMHVAHLESKFRLV